MTTVWPGVLMHKNDLGRYTTIYHTKFLSKGRARMRKHSTFPGDIRLGSICMRNLAELFNIGTATESLSPGLASAAAFSFLGDRLSHPIVYPSGFRVDSCVVSSTRSMVGGSKNRLMTLRPYPRPVLYRTLPAAN